MLLHLALASTLLCLAARAQTTEPPEVMPKEGYLDLLDLYKTPATFSSSCTPDAADLVFGLDGSASINVAYFQNAGLQLVRSSLDQLTALGLLGSGPEQTRIGAFQFGRNDYESFPLLGDANLVKQGIDGIFYQNSSRSKIAEAVTFAVEKNDLFGTARASVKKVLVMLTDCLTNEGLKDFAPAKAAADSKGVEIFIVSYHKDLGALCKDTFTDSDPKRYFLSSDIHDVSQLINCKSIDTTSSSSYSTPPPNWYCLNGGTPGCHCPPGYTGKHCEIPINYCNQTVNYEGEMDVHQLCHWHGVCKYNDVHGAHCICDHPWTGPFCQHYNTSTTHVAHRCMAYVDTCSDDGPETTTHKCSNYERCIPDNINCMFNMPTETDGKGNAYCKDADKWPCDGLCKCKHPIGWCTPFNRAKTLIRAVASSLISSRSLLLPEFRLTET